MKSSRGLMALIWLMVTGSALLTAALAFRYFPITRLLPFSTVDMSRLQKNASLSIAPKNISVNKNAKTTIDVEIDTDGALPDTVSVSVNIDERLATLDRILTPDSICSGDIHQELKAGMINFSCSVDKGKAKQQVAQVFQIEYTPKVSGTLEFSIGDKSGIVQAGNDILRYRRSGFITVR